MAWPSLPGAGFETVYATFSFMCGKSAAASVAAAAKHVAYTEAVRMAAS